MSDHGPAHIDVHPHVRHQQPQPTRSCCSERPATSPRKLFPALYHLEESGTLDVPVIGVARSDWTDDDFCRHAREAIIARRRARRRQGRRLAVRAPRPHPGRLRRPGHVGGAARHARPHTARCTPCTTWRSHRRCSPRSPRRLASVGLNERGRIVVEKPFGRDLASAIELNDTWHSVFPRSGSSGSTTTSARSRRGPARVPLLEHAARTDLEPQLRPQRAGDDVRDDRRRGPRLVLRRVSARSATCSRTTSCRSSRCSRWSRPPAPTPSSSRTRRPR
jgi:hypothetical protein